MAAKDYYEILGVARDADAKTIKRAFLKKARTLHPDVNKETGAEERFKEVNEAYSVLSDERKRANYDRYGTAEGPGGFGADYVDMSDIFGGGFGINDIFDSFFGGAGRGGSSRTMRTRGRDMGITLHITLEEAAAGCKKSVSYDRLAPCDDCGGTGSADGSAPTSCEHCHGTGVVSEVQRTIFGQMQTQTACPVCGGTGKVIPHPCETCDGQGRTPSRETVDIVIEPGIQSGQSVVVPNKGEAGLRGDKAGNLVARIDVVEHNRFERHGDDLYCQVTVDALQAIVGCTLVIDGIMKDEKVELSVPAHCEYGQQLTIASYGMPRRGTSMRGSLIALVKIVSPEQLTDEEMHIISELVEARKIAEAQEVQEAQETQVAQETQEAQEDHGKEEHGHFGFHKRSKRGKK